MGVALWLLCGVAVFSASRVIRTARPEGYTRELVVALGGALLAGLIATALDFGGYREVDWRAGVFVVLCTLAAVGSLRAVLLLRRAVPR